ncbi:MAG: GbsR/MarR family transcriptional regulator [Bacillota bacterium]
MTDDKLAAAREAVITALGRQSAFWGLGKTAGEMFAVLYLNPGLLSLEEVAQRLKVTKGNISIAIRQLEQLGMVHRSWQKGDRRVFFEAETDFWKIARTVLGLRHKPEFDLSFAMVEEGARLAGESLPSAERDAVVERLELLREFYRALDGVVEVALSVSPENTKAMIEMIRLIGITKK